ncbi:hypothetical protein OSTOST_10480 [Ostertagia ostertagi]
MVSITILALVLISHDTSSIPSLLAADPRNALVVAKFAPLILYFVSTSGIDSSLMSVVVVYISSAIACTGMIIRTVILIRSKKSEFSLKTYRLHLNMAILGNRSDHPGFADCHFIMHPVFGDNSSLSPKS